MGSFTFRKLKDGMPISILTVQSDGAIYLNFGEMKVKGVKEEIQQSFQTQVNRIPSVNIPNEAVNVGKYYHINIDTLTEEENMKTFQEAILALYELPGIKGKIDRGLSGTTFIDHVIGVVENALNEDSKHETIRKGYEALQQEYPPHFGKGCYPINIEVQQS